MTPTQAQIKALNQCADDLEAMIRAYYDGILDYPHNQRKFKGEMETVVNARSVIAALTAAAETTPTQAQIEAAAKAIDEDAFCMPDDLTPSERMYWEANRPVRQAIAKDRASAALTAAAEVNEPSKMFAYISGQTTGKIAELEAREEYALGHLESQIRDNEKLRTELAEIIERCAQVADGYIQITPCEKTFTAKAIAAEIRALKDKP